MSNFEKWVLRRKNIWVHLLLFVFTIYLSPIIYLIVYSKNKEYYNMTRNPEKYANLNRLGCLHSKVVGVTYKNDDGTSRQNNLSKVRLYDELNIRIYKYNQNDEAIGIYYKNFQLGNINADLVDEIKEKIMNKKIVTIIAEPTGGKDKTRGCNITIIHIK